MFSERAEGITVWINWRKKAAGCLVVIVRSKVSPPGQYWSLFRKAAERRRSENRYPCPDCNRETSEAAENMHREFLACTHILKQFLNNEARQANDLHTAASTSEEAVLVRSVSA